MSRSDAEIVRNVLDGCVEDFRELIERHQESIYRIALRYTSDVDTAAEITQETFTRGLEHLGNLRDPGYFYGWLRQIALRLCTDWLRARNGRFRSLDTLKEQGVEVGVTSSQPRFSPVEQAIQEKSVKDIVLAEISALPEDFAQILLMRYFEGMSMKEICKALGLKESAAKVRLFRAREALRPKLQKRYSEGELTSAALSIRPI